MSGMISGIVGGVIGIALTAYVAHRVGKAAPPGQLRYGWFIWVLGVACLAFSMFPVVLTLQGNNDQPVATAILFIILFGSALSCFTEAAFVRGHFNSETISHSTPWTGVKNEAWTDLESVSYNSGGGWYTLRFKNGKKIRLSSYLGGHRSVLELPQVASKSTL